MAELQGGFDSYLANEQITYMIWEGAMIVIATTALTVGHPGLVFGKSGSGGQISYADIKSESPYVQDPDVHAVGVIQTRPPSYTATPDIELREENFAKSGRTMDGAKST